MLDRFVAAVIGSPHGIRGHVKVKSLSGETEHLEGLKSATLRKDGVERQLKVVDVASRGPSLVMRFEGYDSPEAARALAGWELLVSRGSAAPLDEDEWYIEDLRGLAVTYQGERLGTVSDVVEGGGAQLVEVSLGGASSGGPGEKRLVPFRKEFVGTVDLDGGTLELLVPWILE